MLSHVDSYGIVTAIPEGMAEPVRCRRCGQVYDLQDVVITQRYIDCSMYRTPCCDREVDDREWGLFPAFRRLR
jgi:hypothetical protein